MKKTITLVWEDAPERTEQNLFPQPKLEIHIDGAEGWDDIHQILRLAAKCTEGYATYPKVHVTTKQYDDEQATTAGA